MKRKFLSSVLLMVFSVAVVAKVADAWVHLQPQAASYALAEMETDSLETDWQAEHSTVPDQFSYCITTFVNPLQDIPRGKMKWIGEISPMPIYIQQEKLRI